MLGSNITDIRTHTHTHTQWRIQDTAVRESKRRKKRGLKEWSSSGS